MESTAADVLSALRARAAPDELIRLRGRLPDGEPALGLRMGDLFSVAKQSRALPLEEVEVLLDHPAYEARMAAFCVLDFRARADLDRGRRPDPALAEIYLRRHDAVTAWDMVDRAAPRVVGAALLGGPYDVLATLAGRAEPLRRRTAITAPLWFVRAGSQQDLAAGFAVAEVLHQDRDPVVHSAVGIFLKHAHARDPGRHAAFLEECGAAMVASTLRQARSKVPPG